MNKVLFSHNSVHWATPTEMYNLFKYFGFYDPCPLYANSFDFDMLSKQRFIYINPPFAHLDQWCDLINYLLTLKDMKHDIYLLMPSRTDTKYFSKIFSWIHCIYFIKGRLHFNNSKACAPFPTLLLHLKNYNTRVYPFCLNFSYCELLKDLNTHLKELTSNI